MYQIKKERERERVIHRTWIFLFLLNQKRRERKKTTNKMTLITICFSKMIREDALNLLDDNYVYSKRQKTTAK